MKKFFIIILLFFINTSFAFSIWIYGNPEFMSVEELEAFIFQRELELENYKKMNLENPHNQKIIWEIKDYERNLKVCNKILERKKDFRFKMKIIHCIFISLCVFMAINFVVFLYNLYKVLFG